VSRAKVARMQDSQRLTLTITEAAAMLGISRNLGYALAKRGELPGTIKLGQKRLVVSSVAIEKLLRGEDTNIGEDIKSAPGTPE